MTVRFVSMQTTTTDVHPQDTALPGESVSVIVSDAGEEHKRFIVDSWVRSYLPFMPLYAKVYDKTRAEWTQWCAERLLRRSHTLVAAVEEYPEVVLGWVCFGDGALHYLYVKGPARKHGIGTKLVGLATEQGPITRITHRPGQHLRAKACELGWRYEPLTKQELQDHA